MTSASDDADGDSEQEDKSDNMSDSASSSDEEQSNVFMSNSSIFLGLVRSIIRSPD